MLKVFLAAVLAVISVPSSAATYIKYEATGSGGFYGPEVDPAWTTATAFLPIDGSGCLIAASCTWSGISMTFSSWRGTPVPVGFTLNFSDVVSGPRISADNFTGGTIYFLGGAGILTRLTVEVVESDDPILAGGAVFAWGERAAIPEPATWAMMVAGFGFLGAALRRHAAPKWSSNAR